MNTATILQYVLKLPIILLALSLHEAAHGYVAYKLGDPTARSLGRLSLNPIKHIDIFGFLCMLLFHFGWAKPVPINVRYFKNPRRGMALSSAAGPISNILLALLFAALLRVEILLATVFETQILSSASGLNILCVLNYILYIGVVLNIGLAIFNLIPIPPFDGSRVAYILLPQKFYFRIMKYEQYIMIAILLLFWSIPFFSNMIDIAIGGLANLIFYIFGLSLETDAGKTMIILVNYLKNSLFA